MLHPHEGGLGASAPPAPHCSNPALSPDLGIADQYRKIESSPMLGKLTAKATESRALPCTWHTRRRVNRLISNSRIKSSVPGQFRQTAAAWGGSRKRREAHGLDIKSYK